MKKRLGVGVALACLWIAGSAKAAVVLDDNFGAWHYSGASSPGSNFVTTATTLTWNTDYLVAIGSVNFPAAQTLAVGQSLSVSFTFTPSALVSSTYGFRVAMLNSNGNPITANGTGVNNTLYNGFEGYGAFMDLAGTSVTPAQLFYRAAGTNTSLLGSGYPVPIANSTGANPSLTVNTPCTGTFTITNTGTGTALAFSMNGTTLAITDNLKKYQTFDTLAIQISQKQAGTVVFSNVTVSTATVPEPGTAALSLAGLAGGGVCFMRRRTH